MSTKAHYFKLGLFVIGGVTLGVIALLIFGAGALFREKIIAETYINESVQGLDIGSPVKQRGVKIGTVSEITFVRNEYKLETSDQEALLRYANYVLVQMAIYPDLLGGKNIQEEIRSRLAHSVTEGLRVRLASQGVTGTAYLEVDFLDPARNPPLDIIWKPKHLYIPSAPSVITRLSQSVDEVFQRIQQANIEEILYNLDAFLQAATSEVKDAQVASIRQESIQLLSELRDTNRSLQALLERVTIVPILNNLQTATERINQVVTRLDTLLQNEHIQQTMLNFAQASEQIKLASQELPETIAFAKNAFRRVDNLITSQQQDITAMIEDLRLASSSLRDLTDNAKRYPAQVLFGAPPPRPVLENHRK